MSVPGTATSRCPEGSGDKLGAFHGQTRTTRSPPIRWTASIPSRRRQDDERLPVLVVRLSYFLPARTRPLS